MIEPTAFGAKMILQLIKSGGVEISKIVCSGGIAEKNDMLMQIYADITESEPSRRAARPRVMPLAQHCWLPTTVGPFPILKRPWKTSLQVQRRCLLQTLSLLRSIQNCLNGTRSYLKIFQSRESL